MQSELVYSGQLSEIAVGRESELLLLMTRLFHGLSNPTRLSILVLLARRGEMSVNGLVRELDAPQPRVSDHLRRLSSRGYVRVRRQGRNAFYSIADGRFLEMIGLGEKLKMAQKASRRQTKEGE